MKRALAVVLIFCCLGVSASQGTDSLQNLLRKDLSDSLRLRILNDLSFQISSENPSLSLFYADEGLPLAEKLQDRKQKRELLHQKALAGFDLSNYDLSLKNFREVLRLYEEDKDQWGICRMLNNLGIVYFELNQLDQALEHYQRALAIKQQLADTSSIANTLNNIGLIYLRQNKIEKADSLFRKSLATDLSQGNTMGMVYTYDNLGRMFFKKQALDSALFYYSKSLSLLPEHSGDFEKSSVFNCIAEVYLQKDMPEKAIVQLEKAIAHGEKVKARNLVKESYQLLSKAYSQLNDFKKAFLSHQQYMTLKDSIFNEESLKKIREIESGYQVQKREKEIEILKKDARISSLSLSRNQMISYFLYSGLFVFFSLAAFLFRQYKVKNTSNTLLKKRNHEIVTRNNHITSSINYAKTIQEAILPQENRLLLHFPDSFALSRPRDIVNGDFFWFYPTESFYLLAVVDCTGHGVPGAFMTVMANSLLNQIIIDNKTYSPASILRELYARLQNTLHNENGFQISKDALDLVICKLDKTNRQLTYSSAKRPVYHIQDSKLSIYKGNKTTLGGPLSQVSEKFQEYSFTYESGSCLYLFTDGFTDQFGESLNKKFMSFRLKELLLQLHQLPMQQQKKKIREEISLWQGQQEQTDDMLLLGLRL